jgi:hypothetical protein
MTSTLTDRLPTRAEIEALRKQVDELEPGVAIQTLLGGIIVGIFWAAAKTMRLIWRFWAWAFVFGRKGWRMGMGRPDPVPSTMQLLETIDRLEKALRRYESGEIGFSPVTPPGG